MNHGVMKGFELSPPSQKLRLLLRRQRARPAHGLRLRRSRRRGVIRRLLSRRLLFAEAEQLAGSRPF